MPVLPVPMIIALVLFGFLTVRLARGEPDVSLLALIGICALQAAVIALVQYYGISALRPLQPLFATVIPPVAWYAFDRASGRDEPSRHLPFHAMGTVLALAFLIFNPAMLDILIPLIFTLYGIAMLARLWGGEDNLQHSRLDSGAAALMAWRIVALALIASAACDVLIAYRMASGKSGNLMWIPSLVSSISLLALGALSLTSAIESQREVPGAASEPSPEDIVRDRTILSRLEDHLLRHKAFLDPDLTLARLAKRLNVPAKQLSSAINRGKRENVSRFINRLRIEEACQLLTGGKSVTTAMFDAGFNTKSNVNREFLRVKGKTPSLWLSEQADRSATSRPPSAPAASSQPPSHSGASRDPASRV
jgi:AraC-like DNA-binding protein